MARSLHQQPTSPLIQGGIFSQRDRKTSREKPQAAFREVVKDYQQLLGNLLRTFTEAVDRAFPNADFLSNLPGSHIATDTRLSFLLCACFGLSQMTLKSELVENYRRTLKEFLNEIKHDPSKKATYTELLNIIHVYQSLANATKHQALISNELTRLTKLDLPPKTIDRRLKTEWSETCLQKPIAEVTHQVGKAIRSNPNLQSESLSGCNNSLAGLARLVTLDTAQKARKEEDSYEPRGPKA